jgi:hypothetical protein
MLRETKVEMSLLSFVILLAAPVAGIFAYGVAMDYQTKALTREVQQQIVTLKKMTEER